MHFLNLKHQSKKPEGSEEVSTDITFSYLKTKSNRVIVSVTIITTFNLKHFAVGVSFTSESSYYKKMDHFTGLDYQDWETKCLG